MEFVERLELLEERFDELNQLVKNKHDGMLGRHGEHLLELRKEVAMLTMKVAFLGERVKSLTDRVESLEKRVDALERRIEALVLRIEALVQKVERMDARVRRVEVLQWMVMALVVPQALIFYVRLLGP